MKRWNGWLLLLYNNSFSPQRISGQLQQQQNRFFALQAAHNGQQQQQQQQQQQLTDTFGRQHTYLRISVTERCNLRCQYCMPDEGVHLTPDSSLLTTDEIVRLASIFIRHGVTKIRFTGGEPLIRSDIATLISRVRMSAPPSLSTIAMTTNAILLTKKLPSLYQAGLNAVNISLDTLNSKKFTLITRRLGFERVLSAIDFALSPPYLLNPVKINCVVMKGINDDEINDFVAMTETKAIDVRFIEYMPFDGNQWSDNKFMPYSEMIRVIQAKFPALVCLPKGSNDTAKSYHIPGFAGRVSFITSMSDNCCNTCNRLRLTADGNLKVCLFGQNEVTLRDAIRSGATDEELSTLIANAVNRKKERHAGMYNIATQKNRPMILIGG